MPAKLMLTRLVLCAGLAAVVASSYAGDGQAVPSFTLPAYQKAVLPNGLTVYLMERHAVPMIHVTTAFPAGAVYDGDPHGLASLCAESLLLGTRAYTKQQLEQELDFIGASYWASASEDGATLSLSFVNTDQDTAFRLFKEIVCRPRFDTREIDKLKKQWLTDLARDKERPSAVIQSYFNKALFSGHPYGNPVSGTPEAVSRITSKHVQAFYRSHYDPRGSCIAVVGDFRAAEMQQRITALLADWKPGTSQPASLARPTVQIDKPRVLMVNKDDAGETQFLIGCAGVARNHQDFAEIQVVNTILGGRFTSWLNDELRVNRGLTYGARSSFRPFKLAGTFTISSFTKTEHTQEALTVALSVLNRLHSQGVDEATLSSAKNYISGQFPTRHETPGSLASLLADMFLLGFDEGAINTFLPRVQAMTPEKTRQIIEAYFPRDRLQFVLIGKASALREQAKVLGEVTEKDLRTPGF
jgi:zinc protease